MEIVARIEFKNKKTWKRAEYSYYVANDFETILKFAGEKAHGRDYVVQADNKIGISQFSWRAVDVFDLDNNCVVKKVVDGIPNGQALWVFGKCQNGVYVNMDYQKWLECK